MKLFMIRWPNGETSLVGAPTKDAAMHFADCAWADPYDAEVTELKYFAADLKPRIVAEHLGFEIDVSFLGDGGEQWEWPNKAYPLVAKCEEEGEFLPSQEQMEEALKQELERVKTDRTRRQTPLEAAMGWGAGSPIAKAYGIEHRRRS